MGLLSVAKTLFTGKNPVKEILGEVDNLHTSAEEKATLRKSVVEAMVDAQAGVIQAEYNSGTWLSRSWRPLLMLMWGSAITYNFFLGPLLGTETVPDFPERFWDLLILGIGGYVGGRSVEKITKTVMPSIKMAKLRKKLLAKGIDPDALE